MHLLLLLLLCTLAAARVFHIASFVPNDVALDSVRRAIELGAHEINEYDVIGDGDTLQIDVVTNTSASYCDPARMTAAVSSASANVSALIDRKSTRLNSSHT